MGFILTKGQWQGAPGSSALLSPGLVNALPQTWQSGRTATGEEQRGAALQLSDVFEKREIGE